MEHGEILYHAEIKLNPKSKKNNEEIVYKVVVKNGVRKKVPCIIQGEKYRQYETQCGWFLTRRPRTPISEPVNIREVFYREDERRCDLSNMIAAIDDILVKYGIIVDDNWKVVRGHDGSTVYVDKKNPRVEIYVERWQE